MLNILCALGAGSGCCSFLEEAGVALGSHVSTLWCLHVAKELQETKNTGFGERLEAGAAHLGIALHL